MVASIVANLGGGKYIQTAGASSSKGTTDDVAVLVFFGFFFGGPLHR